jgi:hypothetical protein
MVSDGKSFLQEVQHLFNQEVGKNNHLKSLKYQSLFG